MPLRTKHYGIPTVRRLRVVLANPVREAHLPPNRHGGLTTTTVAAIGNDLTASRLAHVGQVLSKPLDRQCPTFAQAQSQGRVRFGSCLTGRARQVVACRFRDARP